MGLFIWTPTTFASPAETLIQNSLCLAYTFPRRSADTRPASQTRSQTSPRADPASWAGWGGRRGVGPLLCFAFSFAVLLQMKFTA